MARKPASPTSLQHRPSLYEARLEALFASIGEGVVASNERGRITRINQRALDMLGYERAEVIGEPFVQILVAAHENGRAVGIMERPIMKAFLTGRTVSARTLYQKKNGDLLPVQLTVSPVILRSRPIGAIEVFRDLTAEIENDKLKSDFISIASHQLRTPLSAINMYARMLEGGLAGELTEQQRPYLQTILGSVERMNTLIDTLLNITRIEAGSIHLKLQHIRVDDLAREILAEFVPAAQAKNITLTADIPTKLPSVYTDGLLVKEICANLLSNAIKYTADGGQVRFSLTATPKEILWQVTDTGYGIPAVEQKNIFLKFFRAGNITTKDVSGTGLGLYLIKNLAETLGGDLWFESQENVGSTFYFSLPKESPPPAAK